MTRFLLIGRRGVTMRRVSGSAPRVGDTGVRIHEDAAFKPRGFTASAIRRRDRAS